VVGDGHRAATAFRLEPQRRRVEVSQLVVAVVVVVVSALVAVVVFSRASQREPVLALATDLGRGAVVAVGDLRVVYVASDDAVVTVPADAAAGLVGRVAVTDLAAGTLVAPALFVDRQVLDPGEGVVGLALSPGEYPTGQLAAGDVVDVIVTGSTGSGVLAAGAEVFDVAELGTQGSRFVSLRMSSSAAALVAQSAGSGGLRLVLVAGVGR